METIRKWVLILYLFHNANKVLDDKTVYQAPIFEWSPDSCGREDAHEKTEGNTVMEEPTKIFLSFAPGDELLRDELLKHLAPLERKKLIHIWHEGKISAGTDWQQEIDQHLNAAPLILLLISPDFFASEALYNLEMQQAMARHDASEARVIPIILRPTDWKNAPLSKLQPLPPGGEPVTNWTSQDAALLAVAQGVHFEMNLVEFCCLSCG